MATGDTISSSEENIRFKAEDQSVDNDGWKPGEKSPSLGKKIRNFDKECAEKLLSVDFTPIDEYPELVCVFQDIADGINSLRRRYNAPEMIFKTSDVRLLNNDLRKDVIEGVEKKEENEAFYDSVSDKVYMCFGKNENKETRTEIISMIYKMVHELAHKATSSLEEYSFLLSEGIPILLQKSLWNQIYCRKYIHL